MIDSAAIATGEYEDDDEFVILAVFDDDDTDDDMPGLLSKGDPDYPESDDENEIDRLLAREEVEQKPKIRVESILLAGGRRELDVKSPKWTSPAGIAKIDAALALEVDKLVKQKGALEILSLAESRKVVTVEPDRVVDSRLVMTSKIEIAEDGTNGDEVVKVRMTARGDKDPDVLSLVREGLTAAPTISSNGKMVGLQVIASKRWMIQLGDVEGAFLESHPIDRAAGPIYLRQPKRGLPGMELGQIFRVLIPLYGFNDACQSWWKRFSTYLVSAGWEMSRMDNCVFFLREGAELVGILIIHVDDIAVGGEGDTFLGKIADLRREFPFRKWKTWAGEFIGGQLTQDHETFAITLSQEAFAEKMCKAKVRSRGDPDTLASPEECRELKSLAGSGSWLAKESRPDLAVQVSQAQQCLPTPNLGQIRVANSIVRRAKQFKDMSLVLLPIPSDQIRLCMHSDAAFQNASKLGTQGGYIIAVTDGTLALGELAPWSPSAWKSYRLKRVVSSTLSGETQVFMDGLGHLEWLACMFAEALYSDFDLRRRSPFLERLGAQAVVDCKSLYDHLISPSSPSSLTDKRCAVDMIIAREALKRLGGTIRWGPTNLMLADALTKDAAEPTDLLRAAITHGRYQLANEPTVLASAAQQRERRKALGGEARERARDAVLKHQERKRLAQQQILQGEADPSSSTLFVSHDGQVPLQLGRDPDSLPGRESGRFGSSFAGAVQVQGALEDARLQEVQDQRGCSFVQLDTVNGLRPCTMWSGNDRPRVSPDAGCVRDLQLADGGSCDITDADRSRGDRTTLTGSTVPLLRCGGRVYLSGRGVEGAESAARGGVPGSARGHHGCGGDAVGRLSSVAEEAALDPGAPVWSERSSSRGVRSGGNRKRLSDGRRRAAQRRRSELAGQEWFEVESKRGASVMMDGEDNDVIGNTSGFLDFRFSSSTLKSATS